MGTDPKSGSKQFVREGFAFFCLASVLGISFWGVGPRYASGVEVHTYVSNNVTYSPQVTYTALSSPMPTTRSGLWSSVPSNSSTSGSASKFKSVKKADTNEDDNMQRQEYQDAIDAAEDGKQANEISAAVWGVTSALCGYNCYQYLGPFSAAQTALTAAYTQAAKTPALLAACGVSAGNAAIYGGVLSKCTAMLGKESAEKFYVALAQATPAGLLGSIPLMGVMKSTEEVLRYCQAEIPAVISTAAGVVATGTTTGATTAQCVSAEAALAADTAAFSAAIPTYVSLSSAIITMGYVCSAAGIGSAITDYTLSKKMTEDTTEATMSLIGATPAVISAAILLLNTSNALVSHNTSGLSSCLTSVLGIAVVAQKMVLRSDYEDIIQENTERRDSLDASLMSPTAWKRFFAEAGALIEPLFGSCAYAATTIAKDAKQMGQYIRACKKSMTSQPEKLSCAASKDPYIAKTLKSDPKKIPKLFAEFEKQFGSAALKKIQANPFDYKLIAELISKDKPGLAPKLSSYFETLPAKIKGAPLKGSPSLGSNTTLSPPSASVFNQPQTLSFGQTSNPHIEITGAPPTERDPAQTAPTHATEQVQDGLYPAQSSLFDVVSKRYHLSREKLTHYEWTTPFNKYSAGKEE